MSQTDGEIVNGSRAGILTFFPQTETMPELPGISVHAESIGCLLDGAVLKNILLPNIFLLRTVDPPVSELTGKRLLRVERLGKRLVLVFEGDLFAVIHLMIAGRFKWFAAGGRVPRTKLVLAHFEFDRV